MLTKLSQWLQGYLESQKEDFSSFIHQMDLYHPDGSINENQVRQVAQHHTSMLREIFSADTLQELRQHLCNCLLLQDLHSAALYLCIYFVPFLKQLPLHSLRLTADEQIFRLHIEQLEALLKNESS